MNQSLYLHIPFCKTKCPYCDFYSLRACGEQVASLCSKLGVADLQRAYVDRCIEFLREQNRTWQTAYIGGGTPSVLAPELLSRLLREINCAGEFTIECNASSVTRAFSRAIAQGGVNRVSMGLQSAIASERTVLGRAGDITQVERAIGLFGMDNLSLDVMLGIPGQSIESLTRTLEFCERAGAKHVSAYLLKIEPGTPFHVKQPQGLPDEDAQAELYLHACEWLERHGYTQYEISNFAKSGHESQHNLNYWRCGAYHAIGPGAHGFTQGWRWHYARDLDAFLQGCAPIDDGPGGDEDERAMLALRLSEGISSPSARLRERAAGLDRYVILDDKGLRLTREGFLLSNEVIGRLLG